MDDKKVLSDHFTPKDGSVPLSDNELEKVSGGMSGSSRKDEQYTCPKCGSKNPWYHDWGEFIQFDCRNCGYEWTIKKYQ